MKKILNPSGLEEDVFFKMISTCDFDLLQYLDSSEMESPTSVVPVEDIAEHPKELQNLVLMEIGKFEEANPSTESVSQCFERRPAAVPSSPINVYDLSFMPTQQPEQQKNADNNNIKQLLTQHIASKQSRQPPINGLAQPIAVSNSLPLQHCNGRTDASQDAFDSKVEFWSNKNFSKEPTSPSNHTQQQQQVSTTSSRMQTMDARKKDPKERLHLSAEYRYRTSINEKINKLKNIICPKEAMSKTNVLSNAIELISKLKTKNEKLRRENAQLKLQLINICGIPPNQRPHAKPQ